MHQFEKSQKNVEPVTIDIPVTKRILLACSLAQGYFLYLNAEAIVEADV